MNVYRIILEKIGTDGNAIRVEKTVAAENFYSVSKHNEMNMMDPNMELVAIYKTDTILVTYDNLLGEDPKTDDHPIVGKLKESFHKELDGKKSRNGELDSLQK